MKLSPKNSMLNLVFCGVLLIITVLAFWIEFDRPWKTFQSQFDKLDAKLTAEELAAVKDQVTEQGDAASDDSIKKLKMLEERTAKIDSRWPSIKQLWLTDFDITDRCTTCHLGAESPRFDKAPHPFRVHSGDHLNPKRHPMDKYGCVVCHEGQGIATEVQEAHGEVHNWMRPRLKGAYAESSCQFCHPMPMDVATNAVLKDAPVFSRGRGQYLQYNCLGCHELKGYRRYDRIGPILTKVASKSNQAWLHYWINNPKDYLPKTKMPWFKLKQPEYTAIAAYLLTLDKSIAPDTVLRKGLDKEENIKAGQKAVNELGCLGCHTIKGEGELFAPDLSRIAEKATPEWIYAWVMNPKQYWPQTAMPVLRMTADEAKLLVAFLASLKDAQPITPADSASDVSKLVATGKKLINEKGCTGCHEIAKFPLGYNAPQHDGIGEKYVEDLVFGHSDIPHTLLDYLKTKVKDPKVFDTEEIPTLMPVFGFDDEQVKSLATFLSGIRTRHIPKEYIKPLHVPNAPLTKGELLLETFNCRGCHKIGEGGNIGPDLSFEGNRINPEWQVAFLQTPVKIRPAGILPTRMPTFGMTPEQATTLAAFFADRNKVSYPYTLDEAQAVPDKDGREPSDRAWSLYWQEFACHSCHSWNGKGGVIGPDQSALGQRLRKKWVREWLKSPQQFIPDVRMPDFELYDDELKILSDLIMGFEDVSPAVWDQMRERWKDKMLTEGRKK